MATTPFSTASVPVAGATPGRVRDTPPGLRRYWLGKPGQMFELPAPKVGREVTQFDGGDVHTSLGGVTTVFRRPTVKRRFVLQWDRLAGRDWQIVYGFWRRKVVGAGPWVFFPPEDINRVDEAVSLCQDAAAWSTVGSGGVTALGPATSPLLPSGVLRWFGAPAGDVLHARPMLAASSTLPDVAGALPYLPSEPITATVWLWASATSQVRLRLSGRDAASAVTGELDTLLNLTTSPQLFTLSAAAAALPAATLYVVPKLVSVGPVVDYFVAAPQVEYAATATPWGLGVGVPRVVWAPDAPGRGLDARLRSATTMNLAE